MSSQTQDAASVSGDKTALVGYYLSEGLRLVRLKASDRKPLDEAWQDPDKVQLSQEVLEEHIRCGGGLGWQLGEVSGGLAVVDADWDLAVRLAPKFMPDTLRGAKGSEAPSHYAYNSPGLGYGQFNGLDGSRIIDIKASNNGRGHFVAVEPTEHPKKGPYHFIGGYNPAAIAYVEPNELRHRIRLLAAASLIAANLPASRDEGVGGRHDLALALIGYLLRNGVSAEYVEHMLTSAWEARGAPREHAEDIRRSIPDTVERLARDEPVKGGPKLEEAIPGMPRRIAEFLDWPSRDMTEGVEEGKESQKPTQAELLIRCSAGAALFHTPEGESYATILVGDGPTEHSETHQIKAKGFRRWLVRSYFEEHERPPGAQALQDALGLLEARAQFEGATREVHVRLAEYGGCIYLDLADEAWRAVEVSAEGWRIVSGSEIPVRFRRPRGMLPLPAPVSSEEGVEGLRELINVGRTAGGDGFTLLVAWLVASLRPTGPYPVLVLQGEQGSAKSTAERILRALVDPSTAPLRTMPRNERDLIIAAINSWALAFDNISTLAPWLSDAICRASTGGGFSARELYTDSEEVLFEATRPVLLNGIADVATRPDLLDRALVVTLPAIPDEKRRPEADLWREFGQRRPAILAGLLDAVSGALRTVEDVRLEGMPRMADFARWVTAAESSLGWREGALMEAYSGNRAEANEAAMEADPVAVAVVKLLEDREQWTGTTGELYKALGDLTDDEIRHTKAWPGAPNALTARLKRLAPALRESGIEYIENREGHGGKRTKTLRKNSGAKDRQQRQRRQQDENYLQNSENGADGLGGSADGPARSADDAVSTERQQEYPIDKGIQHDTDDADSADDELQPHSALPSLAALLESRPEWLTKQARKCIEEGAPERLLKPLSSTLAHTYLGDVRRWEEAVGFVREHLEELGR